MVDQQMGISSTDDGETSSTPESMPSYQSSPDLSLLCL